MSRGQRTASLAGSLLAAAVLWVGALASAQAPDVPVESEAEAPTDAAGDDEGMSLEEISRMLDNPLGNLWIIFTENDLTRYRGDPAKGSKWVNTFLIQPVLPIPLTEKWNLVTRPIIPFITAPKIDVPTSLFGDCPGNCDSKPPDKLGLSGISASRENAWGDIVVWSMLSPSEPPKLPDGSSFVWGLGPSFRFPTATEDQFGSEKYSMGPSAIFLRLPPPEGRWTLGLFQQHHLWSIGGNSDRERVKTSQFQYIYWYSLPIEKEVSVGAFPMINVNWEADNDDKWSVPLGLGFSTTFFVGPMPMRIGAEVDWYVVSPDNYGPKYMFKFFVVPVIPRLIKEPIFGGG
jgi:hypothetical protein